ncbi:MAG: hypothetical protein JSR59_21790 [Proteobacteria bacterium]|nr:hypothetical protein [Pseudomonadota bacterium]
MKVRRFLAGMAAVALPTLYASDALAATYTVFDLPGGDTAPVGINADGDIAGTYWTAGDGTSGRGFVRSANGSVATFNVPAANAGTIVFGINDAGTAVGYWSAGLPQAFVRTRDGTIQSYSVPGSNVTIAYAVNASGGFVGNYVTPTGGGGFVLLADGSLGLAEGETHFYAINAFGDAGGSTALNHPGQKGLIRYRDGTMLTFSVPPGVPAGDQATVTGLNDSGTATGYAEVSCIVCAPRDVRGFVRATDGTFSVFRVTTGQNQQTNDTRARAINADGVVVGEYYRSGGRGNAQGFVRDASGNITTFNVPRMKATLPTAINASGVVTGTCVDVHGTRHGFVRYP